MSRGTPEQVIARAAVWALHEGDSLDLQLPPECADAWIQDPPAGIGFMGKAWDGDRGGAEHWIAWAAKLFKVAFDALKPGAHGSVWALPRTSDWTMQALRRAGFEIRDVMVHVFSTGFPKSLDISKAIDAAAGALDQREVIRSGQSGKGSTTVSSLGDGLNVAWGQRLLTAPATTDARKWAGFGTALKPASEHWIIVRKPLQGTVAANMLAHGCGGINVDAGRVGTDWSDRPESWKGINCHPEGRWPSNLVFSHASWDESACSACGLTMPFAARFCPSCGGSCEVQRAGCRCVGQRRIDTRTPLEKARDEGLGVAPDPSTIFYEDGWECLATCDRCGTSALALAGGDAGPCEGCGALRRWACPVARLDEQSGERSGFQGGTLRRGATTGNGMGYGAGAGPTTVELNGYADEVGGASRFFHCFPPDPTEPFWYSAKPPTAEREAGCEALPKQTAGELTGREDGSAGTQSPRAGSGRTSNGRANHHPTVKGFHLIGHLCDLFVPPGGLVLDLTAGSGTLGAVVAHRHHVTGWRVIMGEITPGYCEVIKARCKHWGARPWRPRKPPAKTKAIAAERQGDLFGGNL